MSRNLQNLQLYFLEYMDLVNRLKLYIESTGLTSTQFADAAGITRPTLSQILSGRNKKISNEILGKLHGAFPDLDIMWLLFGGESNSNLTDAIRPTDSKNGLKQSSTHNDLKETILNGSDQHSAHQNTLKNSQISDDEIASFANDFFDDSSKKVQDIFQEQNIYNKERSAPNPRIEKHSTDVNQERAAEPARRRKIVAITVFYDDNSYEMLTV